MNCVHTSMLRWANSMRQHVPNMLKFSVFHDITMRRSENTSNQFICRRLSRTECELKRKCMHRWLTWFISMSTFYSHFALVEWLASVRENGKERKREWARWRHAKKKLVVALYAFVRSMWCDQSFIPYHKIIILLPPAGCIIPKVNHHSDKSVSDTAHHRRIDKDIHRRPMYSRRNKNRLIQHARDTLKRIECDGAARR